MVVAVEGEVVVAWAGEISKRDPNGRKVLRVLRSSRHTHHPESER